MKRVWRRMIEAGFIIFLFYSNLLMGEFERSGLGQRKGLGWAIADIFTTEFRHRITGCTDWVRHRRFLRAKF